MHPCSTEDFVDVILTVVVDLGCYSHDVIDLIVSVELLLL
jgi:hypothetical protein